MNIFVHSVNKYFRGNLNQEDTSLNHTLINQKTTKIDKILGNGEKLKDKDKFI